jgi:hypothetical protein
VRRYLLSFMAMLVLVSVITPASAGTLALSRRATNAMRRAVLQPGPLPKDADLLLAGKARAEARAGADATAVATSPAAPTPFASWAGIEDEGVTPSDATGAIGPTRYVELVNRRYGIYTRAGALLSTGTLNDLAGQPFGDSLFDVQVMWDPDTQRFYYAMDHVVGGTFTDNRIAFGWSKDASPTTSADWCKYTSDFGLPGDLFPDYPKIGDLTGIVLLGVNTFDPPAFNFVSSDLLYFFKPGSGTTCPAPGTFPTGNRRDLRDEDGSQTFTPVPANQTDGDTISSAGVIVSVDPYETPRNFMTRFTVVRGLAGPVVENPGRSIPIPAYSFPPNAPQPGTTKVLDTLDGRLTNAVSGFDPRIGRTTVWTQHTVAGGAGSEARWYQADWLARTVPQSGAATSASQYVFNAAISPDRANNGVTRSFGSNMVMGFNTSSSTQFSRIEMLSKVGANPQSGFVLVQASPGFNQDHSCDVAAETVCRWGDYSGATPDPTPPPGPTGAVWLTNMWNDASAHPSDTDWRTWNWAATP